MSQKFPKYDLRFYTEKYRSTKLVCRFDLLIIIFSKILFFQDKV